MPTPSILDELLPAGGKAIELAEAENRDTFLCSGHIDTDLDEQINVELDRAKTNRLGSLLLILSTYGGDPHSAYKIARRLLQEYKTIDIFVPAMCKSAGTLLAVAAHNLILGDRGELGPVDIQLRRRDELVSRASGLVESSAANSIEGVAWSLFHRFVREITDLSTGNISFKTAAEVAGSIVTGVMAPVMGQVNPLKLGENSRAMKIAVEYINRLESEAKNLKGPVPDTIDTLVSKYPDHEFVIDRKEAATLFNNVTAPNESLIQLATSLPSWALLPYGRPLVMHLNGPTFRSMVENANSPTEETNESKQPAKPSAKPRSKPSK